MKRKATKLLTTVIAIGLTAGQAMSAMVCGIAQNAQGDPISGATITIKDSSGKVLGETTTGSKGQYEIDNLSDGTLDLFFAPGTSGAQGGSGVLDLSGESKMVNWQVASNGATASQGGTCVDPPAGLKWDEWAAIGVLGLTFGGGIAAIVWEETGDRRDKHHTPFSPLF